MNENRVNSALALPYVRNAPLLDVAETGDPSNSIFLVAPGDVRFVLQTDAAVGLSLVAQRLTTAWNFHDPLVDALDALVMAPGDLTVLAHAQRVLAKVKEAEDNPSSESI